MSVIADFSLPAEEFALGHLLEVRPGVQVRLESMVPTGETMIPYFWVESPDVDAVEEALLESPIVEAVTIVDRVGDEALFRVDWTEDVDGVVETIKDTGSVILGEGVTATTGRFSSASPTTTTSRPSTEPSWTRASRSTSRASTTRWRSRDRR